MKQIVQQTLQHEGIRGLYKGFGIHIVGSIPAAGLYFGSYEMVKQTTL